MEKLTALLQNPLIIKILKFLVWAVVILVAVHFFRRLIKRKIDNSDYRYKIQKLVEIFGFVLIGLLGVMYVTLDSIRDYTLIIGLFTAGITFTLQELILSVAGSFYIFTVRVYKPGDRIEINGIKGDVIDIGSIYTTLMELGQWVSSDNYSGRIVKISNSFVFKGPIMNYSMDFPFVWDELDILVTYDSDLLLAREVILREANDYLMEYTRDSSVKWEEMVGRYYIENARIEPSLAQTITSNWIQLNLRYITDYRLRRNTGNELFARIERAIAATGGKIKLASTTLQLLKIPEVAVRVH